MALCIMKTAILKAKFTLLRNVQAIQTLHVKLRSSNASLALAGA